MFGALSKYISFMPCLGVDGYHGNYMISRSSSLGKALFSVDLVKCSIHIRAPALLKTTLITPIYFKTSSDIYFVKVHI